MDRLLSKRVVRKHRNQNRRRSGIVGSHSHIEAPRFIGSSLVLFCKEEILSWRMVPEANAYSITKRLSRMNELG